MRKEFVIAASMAACIMLFLLEQVMTVDYATKTAAKVILFAAVPCFYLKLAPKANLLDGMRLQRVEKSAYRLELILGTASFAGIIAMYFLLSGYIDFGVILGELRTKAQITSSNYAFIGIYIILGNSFLEEFFFRGFIFLNLFNQGHKKLAYIYSSALFGIYHISILKAWVNPILLGAAIAGLILVGAVFNWLDSRRGNILSSWIVHMLADCAVITIGLRMFGMIGK